MGNIKKVKKTINDELYEDVPSPEEYMKMMGITSPEHLRQVVKSMPKLNISCFVIPLKEEEDKAKIAG